MIGDWSWLTIGSGGKAYRARARSILAIRVLWPRRWIGRDEDGIVAADIADHLGPAAAIERQRDALCGADSRLDHHQIRAGGGDCHG